MTDRVFLAKGVAAACVLALIVTFPLTAQDSGIHGTARVRVMIPDSMPAFDPDVGSRHEGAVVPWALVFPVAIGETDVSEILLNPQYARLPTYKAALALLSEALSDGRTEIIVVRPPLENAVAYDDASDRALELRQLRSSVKMLLPRVRSFGRIIEVEITYEQTAG